jgi:hypothetical protein
MDGSLAGGFVILTCFACTCGATPVAAYCKYARDIERNRVTIVRFESPVRIVIHSPPEEDPAPLDLSSNPKSSATSFGS